MKKESTEKKKGAPEGNQFARKHGFYSRYLDEKEQREYERAIQIEGLDEEIALMRVKLMSLIEKDPENYRLITQAINALIKMVMIKCNLDKGDKNGITDAVMNVLKNIAVPAGIAIASGLMK